MKKAISYALFGKDHQPYAQYLPAIVRAHHNLFEEFDLNIYIDNDVLYSKTGELINFYQKEGLLNGRVVLSSIGAKAQLTEAMLWRMIPVFEPDVEYVFCRDLDDCPTPRGRLVCDQFMASDAVVHTVHDNALHIGIMGGLCGFHAPKFRQATGLNSLDDLYERAGAVDWSVKGTDQDVLNRICLGSKDGPLLFEHRFNGYWSGPDKQPKRAAGKYLCPAVSAPVPDKGNHPVFNSVAEFTNHLGAAGYDLRAALDFWDTACSDKLHRRITVAETLNVQKAFQK